MDAQTYVKSHSDEQYTQTIGGPLRDYLEGPPEKDVSPFQGEPDEYSDIRVSSLCATLYNLVKTAVGCGMIFLPGAMHKCGFVLGIGLIIFSGAVTLIPQVLLSSMSMLGVNDYITLAKRCYGKKAESLIVLLQLLILFAPMIAYIKLNGQFASNFLMYIGVPSDSVFSSATFITICVSVIFIFPLCLMKNLSRLAFSSIMGLLCIGYLSILTIADYIYESFQQGGALGLQVGPSIKYFSFGIGLLSAFNTFMMAYTNHPSVLPLIAEMKCPTLARRRTLIYTSQGLVFAFYLLTTTFGYLHFGEACGYKNSYIQLKSNPFYLTAQLFVVFVNTITFPLIHWPARLSLDWLLREIVSKIDEKRAASSSKNLVSSHKEQRPSLLERFDGASSLRHFMEAVILISICSFFAIVFPTVLSIFDFFIPLAGSFVLFTIPSVCYIKCRKNGWVEGSRRELLSAYFSMVMGVVHFAVGTPAAMLPYFMDTSG